MYIMSNRRRRIKAKIQSFFGSLFAGIPTTASLRFYSVGWPCDDIEAEQLLVERLRFEGVFFAFDSPILFTDSGWVVPPYISQMPIVITYDTWPIAEFCRTEDWILDSCRTADLLRAQLFNCNSQPFRLVRFLIGTAIVRWDIFSTTFLCSATTTTFCCVWDGGSSAGICLDMTFQKHNEILKVHHLPAANFG